MSESTRTRLFGAATDDEIVASAERFADEQLFPAARAIDAEDWPPAEQLDLMADAGFFGLAAAELSPSALRRATAAFAGGSLGAAFLWTQHQGALGLLLRADSADLREQFVDPIARGALRAGVGITGMFPPNPLTVRPTDDGFVVDGTVPWLTGWGAIDLVVIAALGPDEVVHYLLMDAVRTGDPMPASLVAEPYDLVAARSARTHEVTFTAHPVPADRLVSTIPRADLLAGDAAGLAQNGSLALGVAGRAIRLADAEQLEAPLAAAWTALESAGPDALPAARAQASELAVRAAATLATTTGARSLSRGTDAERLTREALFLMPFATRPSIRAELLSRFAH